MSVFCDGYNVLILIRMIRKSYHHRVPLCILVEFCVVCAVCALYEY